ncbi:hypothetical protein [Phormidium sp. CCY1219]|uniref:hypothetical protein n=1 Tax=Phormidium sp. CCY1219 TaxID=2886104 RepID=UPI002D1F22AF|nr:hypothetical protein [Phormidium sp. CCY1219]MEB3831653.1 hypothetical protein [Phormidium sp. CCY1219]
MESLQKQVIALNQKVDVLYDTIDELSKKVSQCFTQRNGETNPPIAEYSEVSLNLRHYAEKVESRDDAFLATLEHKDILVENNYRENHYQPGEVLLTPEVQIQRLTAQLTAAYHRIAALEEQLLAKRTEPIE